VAAATGTTAANAPAAAECWFEGERPAPTHRYERDTLPAGWGAEGPAIIEDEWSTTVVPPGATARTDDAGHIHIDTGEAP